MAEGYCLLLGSERSRERAVLAAARATELPVAIMLPGAPVNMGRYADLLVPGNAADPRSALESVEIFEERYGLRPQCVVPLTEHTLSSGAAIAARYGLPYQGTETMGLVRNKLAMKRRFAAAGVPVTLFREIGDLADLRDAAAELGFPLVIKPQCFGGSEGVILVRGAADLARCFQDLCLAIERHKGDYGIETPGMMAEAYIDAVEELSVEIFNCATGPTAITVTDMWIGGDPYFVNTGHAMPGVHLDNRAVTDTALNACKALGITRGMAVVELKLLRDGRVLVIEVNARPGGDNVMEMLERLVGVNLFEHHIKSYLEAQASPLPRLRLKGRSAVAFLKAPVGLIQDVWLPSADDLWELSPAIVGLRIWRRAGDSSQPSTDSNTRDGIVEFYWPDPEGVARDAHMTIAADLERRCFRMADAAAEPLARLAG